MLSNRSRLFDRRSTRHGLKSVRTPPARVEADSVWEPLKALDRHKMVMLRLRQDT